MSFEKEIIGIFKKNKKGKKEKEPKEQVDDIVKKITYVVFLGFVIFTTIQMNNQGVFNKTKKDKTTYDNVEKKINKEKGIYIKTEDSDMNTDQEAYTIVSNDFINRTIDSDYIYVSITKGGKKKSQKYLPGDSTIINFDLTNYIDGVEYFDKNKKYIIFVKNISDIKDIKNMFLEKKFENVYFKILE